MTLQVIENVVQDVSALELHDAVLEAFRIDVRGNSLVLSAQAYLTSDSKTRTQIEIEFVDLRDMSGMLDLAALAKNATAGNINYWTPSTGEGKTFVYLSDGCIAITAREVRVRVVSS